MENVVKRTLIFVVHGVFLKNYSCRFLLLLLYLRITVAFLFTISLLNISVDHWPCLRFITSKRIP